MFKAPSNELQTLDIADLSKVIGGTSDDTSSLLLMALARQSQEAVYAPATTSSVPSWTSTPTITVDGQPQTLTSNGSNTYSLSTSPSTTPLSPVL
jgi:hypothetical protein